ncbi:MAG: SMP-30/gluconolactonase/LRE family protein [Alphaproteobacteria bacterium]|nr:SMP-30/gluconolactonase/LRE family protein [Alphaproteobacteria bacterium]MBV9370099.1 SMP-30/gluconolactonase/LRE family protein [Alphaproteobacteria bacterium]MBV9901013.1 SMP-30/gluconolactonase/LRE family protein [Alphaproteobacteria bacterium]
MTSEPRNVWDLHCELGEGPVWVDGALWFTDIKTQKVHRYAPATGARKSWSAPEQIGFVLPAEGGGFVAGLQSGLHRFDPESGAFALIAEMEPERPNNRLNDGAVDPLGRLWFGTMDNGEKEKSGAFYRFERGALTRTGIEGIAITNGPCLSPDGRILYFVDTLAGTIEAADVDERGALSNRRPFVAIDPREGHPDGPTIDSEGCVWIGLYAGWEARRYSPAGELIERVRFPVSNITKIAFGGDDLRTVYATTARQLLKPDRIAKQPEIGDLFEFRVAVPGIPCPRVAL